MLLKYLFILCQDGYFKWLWEINQRSLPRLTDSCWRNEMVSPNLALLIELNPIQLKMLCVVSIVHHSPYPFSLMSLLDQGSHLG